MTDISMPGTIGVGRERAQSRTSENAEQSKFFKRHWRKAAGGALALLGLGAVTGGPYYLYTKIEQAAHRGNDKALVSHFNTLHVPIDRLDAFNNATRLRIKCVNANFSVVFGVEQESKAGVKSVSLVLPSPEQRDMSTHPQVISADGLQHFTVDTPEQADSTILDPKSLLAGWCNGLESRAPQTPGQAATH